MDASVTSISSHCNSFLCVMDFVETVDGKVFKLGNTLNKQSEKQQLREDSSETLLEKVPGFDGVQVLQIAAGAEHSAAVTGK